MTEKNLFNIVSPRNSKKLSLSVKYNKYFLEVVATGATSGSLSNVPERVRFLIN